MRWVYLSEVDSTQLYLLQLVKEGRVALPVGVWTECQRAGIGSRGRRWEGVCGNLFLSVAIRVGELPSIPSPSYSIYFGWLIKKIVERWRRGVVLKWPNDLYLLEGEKRGKVGGVLTHRIGEVVVVGIGLNTRRPVEEFPTLSLPVSNREVVERFGEVLKKPPDWKEVISQFQEEFNESGHLLGVEGVLTAEGFLKVGEELKFSNR